MTHSRQELLGMNPTFTAHLVQGQRLKYRPNDPWVSGQQVYLEQGDEPTVLTAALAEQLNAEDKRYFLDNCDKVPLHKSPDFAGRARLVAPGGDTKTYLENVGEALRVLSKIQGPLMILGDWNTPWLSQSNDYPPVEQALNFLREQIDEQFNGGFVFEEKDITNFIPHLFWLSRCNASLPEFLMSYVQSDFVVSICKHGILHLEFYDMEERQAMMAFFRAKGFREWKECADPIPFDELIDRQFPLEAQS